MIKITMMKESTNKVSPVSCGSWGLLLLVLASSSVTIATGNELRPLRRHRGVIQIPELKRQQQQERDGQPNQYQSSEFFSEEQLQLLEESISIAEETRFLESVGSFSIGSFSFSMPEEPITYPTTPTTPVAAPTTPPTLYPYSSTPGSESPGSLSPGTEYPDSLPPVSQASIAPQPTDAPTPAVTVAVTDPPTAAPTAAPTTGEPSRADRIQEKCGSTEMERSRDILTILMQVSEGIGLVTSDTPAFQARLWLDEVDEAIVCPTARDRIEQRYRSAFLYYQMNGPSWTNCRAAADATDQDGCFLMEDEGEEFIDGEGQLTNRMRRVLEGSAERERRRRMADADEEPTPAVRFLDASHECGWFGLDCGEPYVEAVAAGVPVDVNDVFLPVVSIDLTENNLAGELFEELYGFTELEGLYLGGNRLITGSLSSSLGNLYKLNFLDIDDNSLSGSLPPVIYTMTTLLAIDLNDNNMVGEISNDIGNLLDLGVLQLEHNSFSGEVPIQGLLMLESLVALTIEGNMLTGTFEPLCDILDNRREENDFEIYLLFLYADCLEPALVECSCCTCF